MQPIYEIQGARRFLATKKSVTNSKKWHLRGGLALSQLARENGRGDPGFESLEEPRIC